MTPLVSCICPTYARAPTHVHLIEEAIESFLRQDWPSKELIVWNDAPEQTFALNAPGVVVINSAKHCASLGDKYNAMVQASSGELICPWEDDDISLPHRLRSSVYYLGSAEYWNPQHMWFLSGAGLDVGGGVCHAASIYRRAAWHKVGGYPDVSGNQDALMDHALTARCERVAFAAMARSQWSYIYRWGVSPYHFSTQRPYEDTWARRRSAVLEAGCWKLKPHWQRDYAEICRQGCDKELPWKFAV
jgi:glycosyltransferase involved in cell wall biosynthesis